MIPRLNLSINGYVLIINHTMSVLVNFISNIDLIYFVGRLIKNVKMGSVVPIEYYMTSMADYGHMVVIMNQ